MKNESPDSFVSMSAPALSAVDVRFVRYSTVHPGRFLAVGRPASLTFAFPASPSAFEVDARFFFPFKTTYPSISVSSRIMRAQRKGSKIATSGSLSSASEADSSGSRLTSPML